MPVHIFYQFIFTEQCLVLGRKAMTNLGNILKSREYFTNKGPYSQSYGFSSSHVWIWELDYKEGWVLKNWCFWTVVLEKTLESPLDFKEIKPVNCKGNWSWIFIGRTDAGQYFGHLMWRTDSLEKTFESLLDCKEIQPVNTKGNWSWIFIGRTDAEAETLATWCKERTHW